MQLKPKKSLGQNFLIDGNIIDKIISVTKISNREILEVGPGSGNLTERLLNKNPSNFYVVEKDGALCNFLDNKFSKEIKILNNDILKIDENKISKKKLIVFGNLPYNISTEILCKWIVNLEKEFWFEDLILMFQKEVGERIIASPNTSEYGRLAILSQWRLKIKKIVNVSPNSFFPKPKIESIVLHFQPKDTIYKFKSAKNLEHITNIFFNQRRKMIKNPFKQIFKNYKSIANDLKIDLSLRPQNLSLENFYQIVKEYEKLRR